MFDSIPVSMLNNSKSIAVFGKSWAEVISIIDQKFDVIELVASMKFNEKPPRRLFYCRRIEVEVVDIVGIRINCTVQPELLTVEADYLSSAAS